MSTFRFLFAIAWAPTAALAIIVADPSNTVDTSTHPDPTFPQGNTGFVDNGGGGSATYLGNGWVITALHNIGATNDFVFNGITYPADPNQNGGVGYFPVSASESPDLALLQISGRPNLPSITLTSSPLSQGVPITMIGTGHHRESYDNAGTTNTADDFYIWATRTQPVAQSHYGTNQVDDLRSIATEGQTFTTTFSNPDPPFSLQSSATSLEAQATSSDSGGGAYTLRNGVWQLVGVMYASSNIQPDNAITRYNEQTYFVDLYPYRNTIESLRANPAPLTATTPYFTDATDFGNGWYWLPWLDFYNSTNQPWLYLDQHGWWYVPNPDPENLFFYSEDLQAWHWTTSGLFPDAYDFDRAQWVRLP